MSRSRIRFFTNQDKILLWFFFYIYIYICIMMTVILPRRRFVVKTMSFAWYNWTCGEKTNFCKLVLLWMFCVPRSTFCNSDTHNNSLVERAAWVTRMRRQNLLEIVDLLARCHFLLKKTPVPEKSDVLNKIYFLSRGCAKHAGHGLIVWHYYIFIIIIGHNFGLPNESLKRQN